MWQTIRFLKFLGLKKCKSPTYNYYLASDKKATTDPMIFKNKFLEIKEQYYTHEEIYTDGSKDGEKVASAAILDGKSYQFRLPNNSSFFCRSQGD